MRGDGVACVRGSQSSCPGTQDLSSSMIPGKHTRKWGVAISPPIEGSLWDPRLPPSPYLLPSLSQVRSGMGR